MRVHIYFQRLAKLRIIMRLLPVQSGNESFWFLRMWYGKGIFSYHSTKPTNDVFNPNIGRGRSRVNVRYLNTSSEIIFFYSDHLNNKDETDLYNYFFSYLMIHIQFKTTVAQPITRFLSLLALIYVLFCYSEIRLSLSSDVGLDRFIDWCHKFLIARIFCLLHSYLPTCWNSRARIRQSRRSVPSLLTWSEDKYIFTLKKVNVSSSQHPSTKQTRAHHLRFQPPSQQPRDSSDSLGDLPALERTVCSVKIWM